MGVTTGRILAIVFALLFVMGGIVVVSSPAQGLTSGDFEYRLINGDTEVEITGYNGSEMNVVIPETIDGKPVRSIGDYAFQNRNSLNSVIIPEGVTKIGNFSFNYCSYLTSISIPKSISSIGQSAFAWCLSLTVIDIPTNVTSIRDGTFADCHSLATVKIPNSVTRIGNLTFAHCWAITSIQIPNSVTYIGDYGFANCYGLLSINIPNSVTYLGERAIVACTSLINVTLSNNITSIRDSTFYFCSNLASITIPSNITSIGDSAFKITSLSSIKFLGLTAPTYIGSQWIEQTGGNLRGHAYRDSNFPTRGEAFYGLIMGDYLDPFLPGIPTGLAGVSGNSQVELNWTAPSFDGGGTIDYYSVFQDGAAINNVASNSTIITGLENGQSYSFTIAAHNAAGLGEQSTAVLLTPFTVSDAPTGLNAIPGNTQVYLNWTAPIFNGGGAIDYFIIYQDGSDVKHVINYSTSISGLTNGQSYTFTVAASNLAGLSPLSTPITIIPFTIPGIPIDFNAIAGNSEVSLMWTAPVDDGGSTIDYFFVYQDDVEIMQLNKTGCTISNLENGLVYSFGIAAHNDAGIGPRSTSIYVTPLQTVPTKPRNVLASSMDNSILIEWSVPLNDGGYAISSYLLYRSENNEPYILLESIIPPILQYTDQSVVPGATYSYYLVATNQLGPSANSDVTPLIYAYSLIQLEIGSSSSINALGIVNTLNGKVSLQSNNQPVADLEITLAYSVNNGNSWIDLPTVISSSDGSFNRSWIPTAEGVYLIRAAWLGNDQYPSAESTFSLAITISTANDIFTVQSNSVISNLLFNSETKQLSFTVSGESGTSGYTKIIISKELVADGNDIVITLDGASMNYELSSTETSWVLYFTYSHSSHIIVAELNSEQGLLGGDEDTTLLVIGLVLIALVSIIIIAVVYRKQKGKK
ncbi:MAG: leucine-rich repeat protein [Methanomassiliicoccales archaeon]